MNKHLTLVPEQRKELESDLTQEAFLKDYEKNPSFKAFFEFKAKMFTSMKSKSTSLALFLDSWIQSLRLNSMWMKHWTSVGLLSFQKVTLRQVSLAGERRMSQQYSDHC